MDPDPHQAIHHERPIRIICIGAGASGLCLAYKLQRSFREFSLTVSHSRNLPRGFSCTRLIVSQVYEKNPDISGTWYENKYPGQVVIPSNQTLGKGFF